MSHRIEQNLVTGNVDTRGDLHVAGNLAVAGNLSQTGARPTVATGITAAFDSPVVRAILTLSDVAVTITDADTDGGYGAVKLCDLPAGHVSILGGVMDLALTGDGENIGATAAVDVSLGTAAEEADATLDGTSGDIINKVDAPLTASAGTAQAGSSATELAAALIVDGTSAVGAVYLNIGIPDAGISADGTITVSGTVTVLIASLGDYA